MSAAHLGEVIDIHAGGQDLVFPHHENEIAQSRCAHGTEVFARYWMHNGFVTVEKRKMSKSLGNTLVVHELLKHWSGEVLRYVLLSAHYRQPLDWSDKVLEQAQATLDRLYGLLRDHDDGRQGQPDTAVIAALEDDLNTPTALAALNMVARRVGSSDSDAAACLRASAALLGLLQQAPEDWFAERRMESDIAPQSIQERIEERNAARARRDFAAADRIRDDLAAHGIVLKDGPEGTTWENANQ
jgi:cysteinyl-tRNA synthetase